MLKSTITILCIFTFCFQKKSISQTYLGKNSLKWAIYHPISSLIIKNKVKNARLIYDSVKKMKLLDTLENGGKLDAFRHVYTMAYLSRYVSIKNLRNLGVAHEKDNQLEFYMHQLEYGERPDSLACEMDLRNNELGFLIGTAHQNIHAEDLKNLIINEIIAGNAWYLKRNAQNIYITCQGEPIDLNDYKNKWSLPKCLVKSNE